LNTNNFWYTRFWCSCHDLLRWYWYW
jgi:hypothetical protein